MAAISGSIVINFIGSANSGHIVIVSDISIASGVSNDISFGGNINSFGGNHVFINKMAAP